MTTVVVEVPRTVVVTEVDGVQTVRVIEQGPQGPAWPSQAVQDAAEAAQAAAEAAEQNAITQAGIATTQAGIATTQAGVATTQAGVATTQAGIATTQAEAAEDAADDAASQAVIATAQAGIAVTNAGTATAQAGIATTQAGIAATQAGIATTQAGIATTQAGTATAQAGQALSSANAAAASFDAFDDRFLGAKASAPTVDNDGDPLLVGALYWDTVLTAMRVWTGSVWVNAANDASLTAAASTVPLADVDGEIDASWADALGLHPLLLPRAFLSSSRTVTRGNIVLTPGTADVPSGVTITVGKQAQWLITGDGYSVLQYQAEFDSWGTVKGAASDLVGVSDPQTLENKTLVEPVITSPVINGGEINNASFLIPAAVSHTNTIDAPCSIPAGTNALSIAPIQILSGGVVNVGAGSVWSFLWL